MTADPSPGQACPATLRAPSGEYRAKLLVDEHGVGLGLADKMCWEITGPLSGLVWINTHREAKAIRHFIEGFYDLGRYGGEVHEYLVVP